MRRWLPLAAVVALLGGAMLAAVFANPTIDSVPSDEPRTHTVGARPAEALPTVSSQPTPDVGRATSAVLPQWVGWLVSAVCAAAILAIVGSMVWLLVRDRLLMRRASLTVERAATPTMEEVQRRVRAAIDEGLADLDDTDADPRRAVIACWVRLEEAAAAAGTARRPGDTSTELVARLLAVHLVSGEVLATFAAVYRAARFATHAVDATVRDQARSALVQLRDELMAGVG